MSDDVALLRLLAGVLRMWRVFRASGAHGLIS